MSTADLESRLREAAAVAAPPRSIADEVLRRLPTAAPRPLCTNLWKRRALFAALSGIAAVIAIAFLFMGNNVRLSLADVQAALENQHWVHATFDVGQTREEWCNLRTGEFYFKQTLGVTDGLLYINEQTNSRLFYMKDSGAIREDTPTIYPPGQQPPKWSPRTAWEEFVGSYERASTRPATGAPNVEVHKDTLNGIPAIRFDSYMTDGTGTRFLYTQLWADPKTHLPLRIKTRLQLSEREEYHKDYSTGDYDFPATGPADIFALGVPGGTPIHKQIATAPADVQPILDGIHHAHDNFLKNYRAIVSTADSFDPVKGLDIIWREGENVRHDDHFPALELLNQPDPALPTQITPDALLTWAAGHQPYKIQMLVENKTYSWISRASDDNPTPRVQVSYHRPGSYLFFVTNSWPEYIQWPTQGQSPNFERLPPDPDLPNFLGLRDENGNYRADYYIDPKNDYVCIHNIVWTKRNGQWHKDSESTLSNLQRIADHIVAGTKTHTSYPISPRVTGSAIDITTITLVPLAHADYPPNTFDPKPLTTGATVEGF